MALQSLSNYHSSLIANFLYCVLSAAFFEFNHLKYNNMLLTFTKPKFEQLIKDCVKVHTIRADKGSRWQVGTKIHFWRGNPRNTRGKEKPYHFGTGEVSRIEEVKINPHLNYVVIDGVEFRAKGELDAIAINDGFENWEEMKTFFTDVFVGKLIFWKNCRWS